MTRNAAQLFAHCNAALQGFARSVSAKGSKTLDTSTRRLLASLTKRRPTVPADSPTLVELLAQVPARPRTSVPLAQGVAFHAVNSGVYHNNRSCTEGNNIEARNWRAGTGGNKLCRNCADLNRQAGRHFSGLV